MKLHLIILLASTASITALHAQALDPALTQVLTTTLPPSLVIYIPLLAYCIHAIASIRRARLNGLSWPEAILAFVEGSNVPPHVADAAAAVAPPSNLAAKASLILAGLCMLSLTSCATVKKALSSPFGQTAIVTAKSLGKEIENASEETALALAITKGTNQLAILNAQGVNEAPAQEILRQSEIAGIQTAIASAQQLYFGITGYYFKITAAPTSPAPKA